MTSDPVRRRRLPIVHRRGRIECPFASPATGASLCTGQVHRGASVQRRRVFTAGSHPDQRASAVFVTTVERVVLGPPVPPDEPLPDELEEEPEAGGVLLW